MSVEQEAQRTVRRFKLFTNRDRILVAASGGKDSTALLYLLSKRYRVTACYVNPGVPEYSDANKRNLTRFCVANSIPLKIVSFEARFGASLPTLHKRLAKKGLIMTECALCGVLKRRLLSETARASKATIIATGHTLDDIAQSVLMNLFRGQPWMLGHLRPVQRSRVFIRRVKPLFFVLNADTKALCKSLGLKLVYSRCPYSKHSFRSKVRTLLDSYEKAHPGSKRNIVKWAIKQRMVSQEGAKRCVRCHEPSSKDTCRVCGLLEGLTKT